MGNTQLSLYDIEQEEFKTTKPIERDKNIMGKLKVLELFAGIGACSKALSRLGIEHEIVDAVEIDKYAIQSFNAIHGTNFEPQDITTWDKDLEVDLIMHGSPCQDFSLAGLQAGGDEGSGTRSSLMYETVRIVKKLKPKYVIWENVKNVISKKHIHNFEKYINLMKDLGYTSYYQVLNAKDYGVPQNRERVFTISISNNGEYKFPKKQELKLKLKDVLESNVDEKYYLSEKMIKYISARGTENYRNPDSKINLDIARPITTDPNKRAGTTNYLSEDLPDNYNLEGVNRLYGIFDTDTSKHQAGSVYDRNGLSPTLDTMQGGWRQPCIETPFIVASRGRNPENPSSRKSGEHTEQRLEPNKKGLSNCITTVQKDNWLCDINLRIRKLTPKECWRLMGFDDEDFEKAQAVPMSNTQLYKQAGNSIVVNVLVAIFKELL